MNCTVESCEKSMVARGFCPMHYRRFMVYGDPLRKKLADAGSGTIRKDGYRAHRINGDEKLEHILVAEQALGRPLPPQAIVHHHNQNRSDNKNSNLVILQDRAHHLLIHQRMRAFYACGNANWLRCNICKQYDEPGNLVSYTANRSTSHWHAECKRVRERNRYHSRMQTANQ